MSKRYPSYLLIVSVGLSAVLLVAEELPAHKHSSGADVQKVRQLVATFHHSHNDPQHLAPAVSHLIVIDPQAVSALRDSFEKELQLYDKLLKEPPEDQIKEKIAAFRAVLAELRNDPKLTREMIERVGLPTLDKLTKVYRVWQPRVKHRYQKLRKLRVQLQRIAEFLRQLKADDNNAAVSKWFPVDDYLKHVEQLIARTSMKQYEDNQRIMAENANITKGMDSQIVAGLRTLNEMRIMCGLHPLVVDLKLCEVARRHSADMKANGFFSHESPLPGKKTFQDRARKLGVTASGENIYMGSSSTVNAIKSWFLSPGHHKNMLNEMHSRQGLGLAGVYWTELFGR